MNFRVGPAGRFRLSTLFLITVIGTAAGCDRKSAAANGSPAELNAIAAKYLQGDLEGVTRDLRDYLAKYPADDTAWTILGNARDDADDPDGAHSAYQRALAINPRRVEAITGVGIVHRRRREYDAAVAAYEKALAVDPTYAQAHSSLSTLALLRGRHAAALEHAKKAYDLDPKDPTVVANLAVAHHYNGDLAKRDEITKEAERLGYRNLDKLRKIFTGELEVGE